MTREEKKEARQKKKEERLMKKARKKSLRLAKKEQIRIGRTNANAIGIAAIDKYGLLELPDGRWSIYMKVTGLLQEVEQILNVIKALPEETYLFRIIRNRMLLQDEEKDITLIRFICKASDILEAREQMNRIRNLMQDYLVLKEVYAYELLQILFHEDGMKVMEKAKKRRNLRKIFYTRYKDNGDHLSGDDKFKCLYRVLQYPKESNVSVMKKLRSLGDVLYIGMTIIPLSEDESSSYKEHLESKYNKAFKHDFFSTNVSVHFSMQVSSSREVSRTHEQAVSTWGDAGFIAATAYGELTKVNDALETLGLMPRNNQMMVENATAVYLLKELMEVEKDA